MSEQSGGSEDREPLPFLDPGRLRLHRDGVDGPLRMTIESDRSFRRVRVRLAFPLTESERFIVISDGSDKDIGMLPDTGVLDDESRRLAEEHLSRRYFTPRIVKVHNVVEEFDVTVFDVQTDRGRKKFAVRNLRESVDMPQPNRFIFSDASGNRYEIRNLLELDSPSRALVSRVV